MTIAGRLAYLRRLIATRPELHDAAAALRREWSSRRLLITIHPGTRDGKAAARAEADAVYEAALCELIEPLNLGVIPDDQADDDAPAAEDLDHDGA